MTVVNRIPQTVVHSNTTFSETGISAAFVTDGRLATLTTASIITTSAVAGLRTSFGTATATAIFTGVNNGSVSTLYGSAVVTVRFRAYVNYAPYSIWTNVVITPATFTPAPLVASDGWAS